MGDFDDLDDFLPCKIDLILQFLTFFRAFGAHRGSHLLNNCFHDPKTL